MTEYISQEADISVKKTHGMKRFISIIDQYFSSGGMQIQFNVINRKTLIDAQKNPDNYSDLIVRVAGYSAYFTQLSSDVQQDIIERTEERI